MTALRTRRLAVLARLVVAMLIAVLAWPTLGEACCFGLQAAASEWTEADSGDDCCPEAPRDGEPSEQDERSGPCSCPLSCSSGCVGAGRGLAVAPSLQIVPPGWIAVDGRFVRLALPPAPDPRDILHVPIRLAA